MCEDAEVYRCGVGVILSLVLATTPVKFATCMYVQSLCALGGLLCGLWLARSRPLSIKRIGVSEKMPFAQAAIHGDVVYLGWRGRGRA